MSSQVPAEIVYPPELPITARREDLVDAIRSHQVVVVAGETGSGKSTQLPKLCLEAGRGTDGLIGHTQPRRLAAHAVAARVAEELGGSLGGLVGYQVRFTDRVGKHTRIKLMTDGILLNELQRDRDLLAYDTIIIDEAHERGLNIDFLLGYLAQLLPRRPDLHVVITSATIDTARFAAHFARDGVPAPIFEVSGRTYPVEIRYEPLEVTDEHGNTAVSDLTDGIVEAVDGLCQEGPGDILVFASGELDIRDAADALRGAAKRRRTLSGVEILPLFSRLSATEQQRVFAAHRGRRVVIATNIAETSLTVPGIRYVVDPGLARISRYGRRSKVQRLPIEKISQASANQRSGRCGRLGPGIAIRLYAEEDFEARPAFTEPEITRTNLASVIMQMTALGLGDIDAFPFVEPPDRRQIGDGVALLEQLGALTGEPDAPGGRALTETGRRLARLPLDPRLGRMVLEAESENCVTEVMILAAAMSIQDVRERPRDKPETAAQYHARFAEPGSDFVSLLNLWAYLHETRRSMSGNQFRKRCKAEFLHYLRVREWQDVYSQIRRVTRSLGITVHPPADRADLDIDAVHRAMLAGLLGNVGMREGDRRQYRGTRDTRFVLGRESSLADHPPSWIVAAELVETSRLFASSAATIRPQWIEPLAGDLAASTYSEPTWSSTRGAAVTTERVTFLGLPIVAGRTVNYSRVDGPAARQLFLQHALVEGDWRHDGEYAFQTHNAGAVEQARALEDRLRRTSGLDPEDVLLDHYNQTVPQHVVSAGHFARWFRTASRDRPHLLKVPAELLTPEPPEVYAASYPDRLAVAGQPVDLTYTFDPARPDADGITVDLPLELLATARAGHFDWLVPGVRQELVVALIKALPKSLRRALVPAPQTAARVVERVGPADGPLLPVLARELTRIGGVPVPVEAWQGADLPDHLRIRYRVVEGDRVLAAGRDLAALKAGVADQMTQAVATAAPVPTHTGLTAWTIGDLPRSVTAGDGPYRVTSYPSLVDEGDTVGVAALPTAGEQQTAMWQGTRRLLRLALPSPVRTVNTALGQSAKLALSRAPHPDVTAVMEDVQACVIDAVVADRGGPAWTSEDFEELRVAVRERSPRLLAITARAVADIVTRADAVKERMRRPGPAALDPVRQDIAGQLGRLVYPGFVAATGGRWLGHLSRYLKGMDVRLEAAGRNPGRDAELLAVVADLEEEHRLLQELRPDQAPALQEVRWQLEELRVGLFAQSLGTAVKVSESRLRDALAQIRHAPRT